MRRVRAADRGCGQSPGPRETTPRAAPQGGTDLPDVLADIRDGLGDLLRCPPVDPSHWTSLWKMANSPTFRVVGCHDRTLSHGRQEEDRLRRRDELVDLLRECLCR